VIRLYGAHLGYRNTAICSVRGGEIPAGAAAIPGRLDPSPEEGGMSRV